MRSQENGHNSSGQPSCSPPCLHSFLPPPQVNRVILDNSTKLVGVRLPITALPTLRHHLAEAVQARKAAADSGGGGHVEPVSPIDPKALAQVKTPPKNILSFFGRVPAASPQAQSAPGLLPESGAAAATPSPAGGKRQAGGGFSSGWSGSSASGSGGGGGGGSTGGRKKRKADGSAGGKGGKENSGGGGSNASKGMAALFGARSGGGGGGSGGGGAAERKDFVPEVISIDDD